MRIEQWNIYKVLGMTFGTWWSIRKHWYLVKCNNLDSFLSNLISLYSPDHIFKKKLPFKIFATIKIDYCA